MQMCRVTTICKCTMYNKWPWAQGACLRSTRASWWAVWACHLAMLHPIMPPPPAGHPPVAGHCSTVLPTCLVGLWLGDCMSVRQSVSCCCWEPMLRRHDTLWCAVLCLWQAPCGPASGRRDVTAAPTAWLPQPPSAWRLVEK